MTFEFNETSLLMDNPFFNQGWGSTSHEIVYIAKSYIYIYTNRVLPVSRKSIIRIYISSITARLAQNRLSLLGNKRDFTDTIEYRRIIPHSRSWYNQFSTHRLGQSSLTRVSFQRSNQTLMIATIFYIIFLKKVFPSFQLNSRKKIKQGIVTFPGLDQIPRIILANI